MAGLIARLRGFGWLQWLALVNLLLAYVVIILPFCGVSWTLVHRLSFLSIGLIGVMLLVETPSRRIEGTGNANLSHIGAVALLLMILWGQPWWPVWHPQQPVDFQTFVWSFLALAHATRILSGRPSGHEHTVIDGKPSPV